MISIKTSLAFVIAIALAIIAFFIANATFAANIANFLPSIFVLLTVIILFAVTAVQNPSNVSTEVVKPRPQKSESKQNSAPVLSPSSPSGTNDTATLYVGNLAYKANEQIVQEFFETAGTVKSVRLVKDKRTGRRKGFGFIEINSADENEFIAKLNESEFMERNIIVRPANEKQH